MPEIITADHSEVLTFVETHRLMGSRIGWIDAHLLCSAKLAGVGLWTLDKRLTEAARRLHIGAAP